MWGAFLSEEHCSSQPLPPSGLEARDQGCLKKKLPPAAPAGNCGPLFPQLSLAYLQCPRLLPSSANLRYKTECLLASEDEVKERGLLHPCGVTGHTVSEVTDSKDDKDLHPFPPGDWVRWPEGKVL